jgi:hypothetical protein
MTSITSAADLKFLQHRRRVRPRNFKSISGTGIIGLLVPSWFSKFVSEGAALKDELRKRALVKFTNRTSSQPGASAFAPCA